MPGLNQKGPQGAGPLTGGGRGICRRTDDSTGSGRGRGKGQGQGQGQGRRGGRGRCLISGAKVPDAAVVAESLQKQIDTNQKPLDALVANVKESAVEPNREK